MMAVARAAVRLALAVLLVAVGSVAQAACPRECNYDAPAHVVAATLAGGARTTEEAVQPGGQLIGRAGGSTGIREVHGGQTEAAQLFDEPATGGVDVTPTGHVGQLARLPNGGHIGYRPTSKSGPPTIDINVPGIGVRKIKFVP